ncbi:MAG: PPK2 family polyphosphate kinase [Pseudomonadales bacterium]
MASLSNNFRFQLGRRIEDYPTRVSLYDNPKKVVRKNVKTLSAMQERLYADNRHSLLIVFQGMDTAGKDSTIRKVFSGVNPQGFQVYGFKQPTYREVDHNYLWRYWRCLPERGRIGIFNRSYYEEALVVRVHPEIIEKRPLPHKDVNELFWERRFKDFRGLEEHLAANGTTVIKFFLNVSKEEQRQRLLRRLRMQEKHWKFSSSDVVERGFWDEYQLAFQEVIAHTHSEEAPWYVIPADDKWTMRALVSEAIDETLSGLNLTFPTADPEEVKRFDAARRSLLAEGPESSS